MKQLFTVVYYTDSNGGKPAREFIFGLDYKQKSKVLRDLSQLEEFGIGGHIPDTKKVTGTPFWELRVLGRDNIRVFYVLIIDKRILLLHAFIKKKQKTPAKEINLALKRLHDWKRRNWLWYYIWYRVDMKNKLYTLQDSIRESLKEANFRKEWGASEADYQISRQMIKARLEKKMSQRALAKKAKTSQANISNLEGMNYNPSLAFLKRISGALGIKFRLSI